MPLPDSQFDSAVAYSFKVTIDGVQIPSVVSVSDITEEVDKIEYKQQTHDGKYVVRQLPGRPKPGEFTVTRGMTSDKAASDWLLKVLQGDVKMARKTAQVEISDYQGQPLRKYSFTDCWVRSVKSGGLEAGGTNPLTEEFVVCYDTMKAE